MCLLKIAFFNAEPYFDWVLILLILSWGCKCSDMFVQVNFIENQSTVILLVLNIINFEKIFNLWCLYLKSSLIKKS